MFYIIAFLDFTFSFCSLGWLAICYPRKVHGAVGENSAAAPGELAPDNGHVWGELPYRGAAPPCGVHRGQILKVSSQMIMIFELFHNGHGCV